MLKIEIKTLKNELKYKGTIILTYEIEYPQVYSDYYNTNKFNSFNLNKAIKLEKYAKETLFSAAKDTYDYNISQGFPVMVYELILKTYITYNHIPNISLYQDKYTFSGGAHGSTIRSSQNWNLEYNSQFPLSSIFYNDPNYILYILKQINNQIKKQGVEYYFEDYCSLVLETFKPYQFYLTPYNIFVYFQQYDIAPYSTGVPTFKINYPH